MIKGLSVEIFKNPLGNFTNGGASSRFDHAILVGEGIPEISSPHNGEPVFKLVKRTVFGKEYRHVEPLDNPQGKWVMFGGNFVYTSDSRFPNDYPLAIHDRIE